MNYLDYEEKLIVKEFVEKSYHSFKDKEKFNLLKGSLNIEQQNFVEELLDKTQCYYPDEEKNAKGFKEIKNYLIGKAIIILKNDGKAILEIISLKNFDSGIENFKSFVENMNKEYMENFGKEEEEKERLDILTNEFKKLGK